MNTRNLSVLLAFLTAVCILFTSCTDGSQKKNEGKHEPLTIMTAGLNYEDFEKAFNEKYPEVELQFISYNGRNTSEYTQKILGAGHAPDIYTATVLPEDEEQKDHLIDLSGYDFTGRYAVSRLNECSIRGAIYMLPSNYSVSGIYYNKTLFEKYGWSAPESFEELKELTEKIRSSGVDLACTELSLPGFGFQYIFDIGDTVFLRTPAGTEWANEFLAGKVKAEGAWDETIDYIQQWIDLGMFTNAPGSEKYEKQGEKFIQGNTAFIYAAEYSALLRMRTEQATNTALFRGSAQTVQITDI